MDFRQELYSIEFTEDCIDEIRTIYFYISNNLKAQKAAKELMKKIKNSILNLSKFPRIYAKIYKTDKRKRNFRRISINNYIILYTVNEENKKIYISHMYYSGRNYVDGGII